MSENLGIQLGLSSSEMCSEDIVRRQAAKIEITKWNFGRLGNVASIVKMVLTFSLHHRCFLLLPKVLPGISPTMHTPFTHYFCPILTENDSIRYVYNTTHQSNFCNISTPSDYFWKNPVHSSYDPVVMERFREYFGLNATHSFGHQCTHEHCLALHVRSGDIFSGNFNEATGQWIPGAVNPRYEQPPLEYYLHVIQNFKNRMKISNGMGMSSIIKIACEDDRNPVCGIFKALSAADKTIQMVMTDFLSTLRIIMCCPELAIARSTLSLILKSGLQLQHLHIYDSKCTDQNVKRVTSYEANNFNFSAWHNSELERHKLLQPYNMTVRECHYNSEEHLEYHMT